MGKADGSEASWDDIHIPTQNPDQIAHEADADAEALGRSADDGTVRTFDDTTVVVTSPFTDWQIQHFAIAQIVKPFDD